MGTEPVFIYRDLGKPEDGLPEPSDVELVAIESLLPADSPRSAREDPAHAAVLADSDAVLPPVIVHRQTMRVVDGMHRVLAAATRGEDMVRVRFFDGDEQDAFLIAVRENIAHGLPLTAEDRAAACERIIRSHPHWSDRAIAEATGLSARSVREARRAVAGHASAARTGRDGRVRPLNATEGRVRAVQLIEQMPSASLRQIAQLAGISPSTVRDVRERLSRGEEPCPNVLRPTTREQPRINLTQIVETLVQDPEIRSSERSRFLLRMLGVNALPPRGWEELVEAMPEHSLELISEVARQCALAWTEFADELDDK